VKIYYDQSLLVHYDYLDGIDDQELLTPLERWRKGYLWVTHLVNQLWCEQQLEYGFTRPKDAVEQPSYVSKGSELHLARELESEEYVDVKIESNEDIFAIKILNLYGHLKNVQNLGFCREVPIFGKVGKLFLLGKIDELRWTNEDGIEIREFKTRTKAALPGKAQQVAHNFQLMIYRVLQTDHIKGHKSSVVKLVCASAPISILTEFACNTL